MKKVFLLMTVVVFACTSNSFSQKLKPELYVTANLNVYFPTNSSQGVQSIIQFSNPFSIGGFGIGATLLNPLSENWVLKNTGGITFNKFKDSPIMMTDPSGQSLGNVNGVTRDLNVGIISTINYSLTQHFLIGTGLGLKVLLDSRTNYNLINQTSLGTSINGYYKPLIPVIPIEATLTTKKLLVNLRYEYSPVNRIRGDLADYKTEKYSLISLEIGYKIK